MKKRNFIFIFCLLLMLTILFSHSHVEADSNINYEEYANKLAKIKVFRGSDSGFELDRQPTRLEGLIMLIRLLGKESEAELMKNEKCVFTDVPQWARGYVNYAYKHGLTYGINNTTFGVNNFIDVNSYMTFLLRALGYDDKKGDFSWGNATQFALKVGIIDEQFSKDISTDPFNRGHMALTTYNTLKCKMKSNDMTLAEKLVKDKAISQDDAMNIGVADSITSPDTYIIDMNEYDEVHLYAGQYSKLINPEEVPNFRFWGGPSYDDGFSVTRNILYVVSVNDIGYERLPKEIKSKLSINEYNSVKKTKLLKKEIERATVIIVDNSATLKQKVYQPVALEYTLKIEDYDTHIAEVTMTIKNLNRKSFKIGEIDYGGSFNHIILIEAFDGKGNKLNITQDGSIPAPGGTEALNWRIESDSKIEEAIIKYTNFLKDPENTEQVKDHRGYIGNGFGLFEGGQVFLYPRDIELNPDQISVSFDIPSGSIVVCPWHEENGKYYPAKNFYKDKIKYNLQLCMNESIGVGKFIKTEKRIGNVSFIIAFPSDLSSSKIDEIKNVYYSLMEYFIDIFGDFNNDKYLIVVSPETGDGVSIWAGENTRSQAISLNSIEYETTMIIHQLFHTWNGFAHTWDLNSRETMGELFTEGITVYYESKALIKNYNHFEHLNFIEDYSTLEGDYRIYKNEYSKLKYRYKDMRSDSADYSNVWRAYRQGELIAMELDMRILEDTNGKKSIDDLMRLINDNQKLEGSKLNREVVIDMLKELTGKDYSSFLDSRLDGNIIELDEHFKDDDNDGLKNYIEIIMGRNPKIYDEYDEQTIKDFNK